MRRSDGGLGAGARSAALAAAAFAGALACATPDPDGVRERAQALALGASHADTLHCEEGDCADWYRTRVGEAGVLEVEVRPEAEAAVHPAVTVTLAGARGQALERASTLGRAQVRLEHEASPGAYHLSVTPDDPRRAEALRYRLRARLVPPEPEAEAPRFETKSSAILEVEGSLAEPEAVLLERGTKDGFEAGLEGRLVQGERAIAPIEIEQSFPDGSRARLTGPLGAPLSADTRAEIEVPVE